LDLFQGGGAGATARACPINDAPVLAAIGPARLGDIFLFENAADAKEYLELAVSAKCGSKASQRAALVPPGAHNLEGFHLVNELACALPGARCSSGEPSHLT
jgi:hypothetical protein